MCVPGKNFYQARLSAEGSIPVESVCLDEEFSSLAGVSFIKCDAEGHEREVIEGAVKLIQRDRPARDAMRQALERALAKLTQHQRNVFLLYEVEGFRHAEIAGMLDMTKTASKNTLFQAKKNLRQMLEPPRSSAAAR